MKNNLLILSTLIITSSIVGCGSSHNNGGDTKSSSSSISSSVISSSSSVESSSSSSSIATFIREGDIVFQVDTSLAWQDDESVQKPWLTQENFDLNSEYNTTGDTATTYCTELNLGEYNDWRLPTIAELSSIVELNNYPKIDPVFQKTVTHFYWSSISLTDDESIAWGVYFDDGSQGLLNKSEKAYIRCVREIP